MMCLKKLIGLVLLGAVASFAEPPIRVACVGDSITYGHGIEKRALQSYPAQLQKLLGNQWVVKNFGRNGATLLKKGPVPYWEQKQYKAALQFNPDVVVIKLGTNDSRPENWPEHKVDYVADYVELVRSFQALEGKPTVWLCTSAPVYPGAAVERRGFSDTIITEEIIPMVRKVSAETGAQVIELNTALTGKPELFSDGVHPNAEGAGVIAQTVAAVISGNGEVIPAYTPEQGSTAEKKGKANWQPQVNPDLPNVLILGDSISVGYTLDVRERLKGKANVYRPCATNGKRPENCQGTTYGVKNIDRWLAGRKWDVIHFNWGLHDLKHVDAKTGKNSNSFDDPQQADPATYEKNLTELVAKLKATGATLVFATTTPYPEGPQGPARDPADVKVYNDVALKIMAANGIQVNDLHGLCVDKLDTLQMEQNVHFTPAGRTLQGKTVAEVIATVLNTPVAIKTLGVTYSAIKGLERDPNGFLRRDNSDIIKVGDLYYVWYSKMNQFIPDTPVTSTIWYATSPDGHNWTEKGECVSTGEAGSWDDRVAYTPGILVAEGKFYLFYTAQSTVDRKVGDFKGKIRGIGIAVSDSPDGPWQKLASNPALIPGREVADFDSHVVDDSCLIVRDGKYWLYYKGRQIGKRPTETKMGVAIADKPEGPYIKHESNPLADGGHEVLVWPQGEGVGALVGMKLGENSKVPFYIMYAEDGIHFEKTGQILNQDAPWAPGGYRPEAFTDNGKGEMIEWGLHIGGKRPKLFLERFDLVNESGN